MFAKFFFGKYSPTRKAKNKGKTKGLRGSSMGYQYVGSGLSHRVRYGRSKLLKENY